MIKTFFIHTFGCQMNVLDSEKAAGVLTRAGWTQSATLAEAGLVLFNTCSVREKAVQKVYSHLGCVFRLKRSRPGLLVGVMGCVAQQEGQGLLDRFPGLNLVAGTQRVHHLAELVERVPEAPGRQVLDVTLDRDPEPAEVDCILRETPFRAFVNIADGCDNFCAYCVVPFTRGRERSRSSGLILDELRRLVAGGAVEVMLLGQNVNSYRDPSPAGLDYAGLLLEASRVEGLRRVRFTTSHPKDFNERVLRVMAERETVCNQLHLPAQSGSSQVLAAMNRKYGREAYLAKIALIRRSPRPISLSSDFIVGFPGETAADFEETLSLLDEVRYDSVFSFVYSPRPGTAAARWDDTVPLEAKKERLRRLQARQEEIQLENNQAETGRTVEVLVDGLGRVPGQLSGRTTENRVVLFDGDPGLIGRFAMVHLTACSSHTLRGSLV